MRGKGPHCRRELCPHGITPAYAGKRWGSPCGAVCFRDHPRLCGEKIFLTFQLFHLAGSPPPMRGKAISVYGARAVLRITPAYAGKRVKPVSYYTDITDHPRLCGEKQRRLQMCNARLGSPPPMRGKVWALSRSAPTTKDHPRLCGEKTPKDVCLKRAKGSPPPMRGKAGGVWQGERTLWITPAYAGKSIHMPPKKLPSKDHPRLCGEKPKSRQYVNAVRGSPPPMRGKVKVYETWDSGTGITPAYAGKRTRHGQSDQKPEDHPRLCGEK